MDALNETGGATDRNVLFAPSIALTPEANSQLFYAKWLGPIPTPSSLDDYYRSNSTIPGSAYGAMASSQYALETGASAAALNVPTMVLLDPNDEWISESGIREFMARHKLTNWAMHMLLRSKEAVKGRWRHLIHDRRSLGEHWEDVANRVKHFLAQGRRSTHKAQSPL